MKATQATVKVMLSYNYCHFEVSKVLEGDDITNADIDAARKDCQRLADKAVAQYQKAKSEESKRTSNSYERSQLEAEVSRLRQKSESELSPLDKAKIKTLDDYNWDKQYNYDDDENYNY